MTRQLQFLSTGHNTSALGTKTFSSDPRQKNRFWGMGRFLGHFWKVACLVRSIFGQRSTKLAPGSHIPKILTMIKDLTKVAFFGTHRLCRLIWLSVGWSVGWLWRAGCISQGTFLAVQDSSISDIVCLSVGQSVGLSQLTIRAYGASKSDPRH